ncbi:hypothetical protein E2C01_071162 [Portunus trituberculatus]|uniref:Uncharacterized protein n=1 Tax=Portunus trituberculatus TaxID=210409 RepID=A0A5B7I7I4_PORTR|nr:hypothetical protein [Portunus trituberculatus]
MCGKLSGITGRWVYADGNRRWESKHPRKWTCNEGVNGLWRITSGCMKVIKGFAKSFFLALLLLPPPLKLTLSALPLPVRLVNPTPRQRYFTCSSSHSQLSTTTTTTTVCSTNACMIGHTDRQMDNSLLTT